MHKRLRYLMLEGWYILVAHVHRTGAGVIWFTADGITLQSEKFETVTKAEFYHIQDLFPLARKL